MRASRQQGDAVPVVIPDRPRAMAAIGPAVAQATARRAAVPEHIRVALEEEPVAVPASTVAIRIAALLVLVLALALGVVLVTGLGTLPIPLPGR